MRVAWLVSGSLAPGWGALFAIFGVALLSLAYWSLVVAVVYWLFGLTIVSVVVAALVSVLVPLSVYLLVEKRVEEGTGQSQNRFLDSLYEICEAWLFIVFGFLTLPVAVVCLLLIILLGVLMLYLLPFYVGLLLGEGTLKLGNAIIGGVLARLSKWLEARGRLKGLFVVLGVVLFVVGNALQFTASFVGK
jgi:hypothetical protein